MADVGSVQVPELAAVDLDSESDTCSTASSFSVRQADTEGPKHLDSPASHEHAEAALHLTSYVAIANNLIYLIL